MNRVDRHAGPFFRLPAVAFPHRVREVVAAMAETFAPENGAMPERDLLFADAKGALRFVLECMHRLQPGRDEVIIPAYTCYSVPAAVMAAGLRVVLCDIRPQSLDFDHEQLRARAGPRTLAIVAGHLFRSPVDYRALNAVASSSGAFVIDDAAQGGDPVCMEDDSGVDARIHSFGRGKPVSAGGGGRLSLMAGPLREVARQAGGDLPVPSVLRSVTGALSVIAVGVLTHPRLYWLPGCLPFLHLGETHFPETVAAERGTRLLGALLPRAEAAGAMLDRVRREHSRRYAAALSCTEATQPMVHRDPAYAPHRFPVYVRSSIRDLCLQTLTPLGVSRMYPHSLNRLPRVAAHAAHCDQSMPGAEWIADNLLTLPTHHRVAARDREIIIRTLRRAKP